MKRIGRILPLLLLSICGCTEVDTLGTLEEYGATGPLKIEFDWSGSKMQPGNRPDSLALVLSRTVSSGRRSVKGGPDGTPPSDTILLPKGEWICAVMNEDLSGLKLTGLEEFRNADTSTVKAISAKAQEMPTYEVISTRGEIDPNPDMPYYREIGEVVCGFGRTLVSNDLNNTLLLRLQDMSVNLIFNINVKVENGVEVDRMLGEISGIPGEITMMSREVVAEKNGKTLFDITPKDGDALKWSGSVNVTGIISPESDNVILGNGILCVRVFVTNNGKKMLYVASINLKHLLDENPVLIPTDRANVFRHSESSRFILDIPSTLWLTPTGVMAGADGSGLMEWVNQAKIDGEL